MIIERLLFFSFPCIFVGDNGVVQFIKPTNNSFICVSFANILPLAEERFFNYYLNSPVEVAFFY